MTESKLIELQEEVNRLKLENERLQERLTHHWYRPAQSLPLGYVTKYP